MHRFKTDLPQLDLLIAFEAAARLGSFTRAARELNVSQSAVSQRMQTLEASLAATLFERGHRYVRLTARGREFQNSVTVALRHLLAATNTLRSADSGPQLNIATDESVGALWLLPRLHRFQARHPEISLRLTASDREADCLAEGIHLAILHGAGDWPGYDCRHLFEEQVFPVCAPAYLTRHGGLGDLADLADAELLDLEYERWHWMNWSIWLTEQGLKPAGRRRSLQCNSYPLLIEAARNGQGVALGWRHFIDDDLIAGRLVRPLGASVKTDFAYYVIAKHQETAELTLFRDWLFEERDGQALHSLAPG